MEVLKQDIIHLQKDIESIRKDIEKNETINSKQHKDFYNQFEKLRLDLNTMQVTFTTLLAQISELSIDIKSIKEKPAKRWELIVTTIVTALIAAGLTYLGVQ